MFSYGSEIRGYIDSHKSEIVELLKELVRIPSVRGEAMPDAPFGKKCSDVLLCTEAMYRKYGFECELDGEAVIFSPVSARAISPSEYLLMQTLCRRVRAGP